MIDLRILRDDPELVRASQRARGADPGLVDRLLDADVGRRAAVSAADSLRAEQKTYGRTIGKAAKEDRPALLERGKEMAAAVKAAEVAETAANEQLSAAHLALPHTPGLRRLSLSESFACARLKLWDEGLGRLVGFPRGG